MPRTTPAKAGMKKKGGQWKVDGYRFDGDNVANQMAYLFAGAQKKRAKEILDEAMKRPEEERQQYIEDEVKKRASEVDEGFSNGFTKLMKLGDKLNQKEGKDAAVELMKSLGLNVDPDNVQTNYHEGPPQCFQITWVNRPTAELKQEDSDINKLSECYADTLSDDKKQAFKAQWDAHVTNAKQGGPTMGKTAFELEAAKSWSEFKSQVQREHGQSAQMTPLSEPEPEPDPTLTARM